MRRKGFIWKAFGTEIKFFAMFLTKKNIRSLKTFMGILIKSFFIAIVAAIVWLYTISKWNLQVNEIHAELMRNAQLSIVGIYLSLVFIALDVVIRRYYKLVDYRHDPDVNKEKAMKDYQRLRAKNFPPVFNYLITFFSLMLVMIMVLMPYKAAEFGFWEVFLTIFSLYAVFKTFLHLEDPDSGIWPLLDEPDFMK